MVRVLLIALVTLLNPAFAENTKSVGVRVGASFSESKDFTSTVLFASYPIVERIPTRIGDIRPRLNAGLGLLWDDRKTGVVGSLGPSVMLYQLQDKLQLELGIDVALLSRTQFDGTDFGSAVEFISHLSVAWELIDGLTAGYRFQHMSNAGLNAKNPGLDLHLLSLEYSF